MTQGLNPHPLHYRHILYCWVTWEGHILIRVRQKGVLHTHTHTHTHTQEKMMWRCRQKIEAMKPQPKNAVRCQKMEGKPRMDHLIHGWKKSWCEGAREGEMTEELVPRGSKGMLEEKKITDEWGRQKQEARSWIRKGKMVWWADFETGQMTGKSHNWDSLHYMFLEVFSEDPFIINDRNTYNK